MTEAFFDPGSAGLGVSENLLGGLDVILVEYACTGNESNLSDCLNSSLATCDSQIIAAVRCQGNVLLIAESSAM